MTLGEQLWKAREKKQLSREALAAKVGTTSITVFRTERDRNKPTLDLVLRLVAALGIPVELKQDGQSYVLRKK